MTRKTWKREMKSSKPNYMLPREKNLLTNHKGMYKNKYSWFHGFPINNIRMFITTWQLRKSIQDKAFPTTVIFSNHPLKLISVFISEVSVLKYSRIWDRQSSAAWDYVKRLLRSGKSSWPCLLLFRISAGSFAPCHSCWLPVPSRKSFISTKCWR